MGLEVRLRLVLATQRQETGGCNRVKAAIPGLGKRVRSEGLKEEAPDEVFGLDPLPQFLELVRIIAVVDAHRVSCPNESMALKPGKPAHPFSSSSIPVGTSAEQLGHVAVAILPTTKVKSHSGHCTFGSG